MKLGLLLLCVLLAMLFISCEMKKKKDKNHHDRHGHHRDRHGHHRDKRGHGHRHGHGRGRGKDKDKSIGRFDEIINDFFFQIFAVGDSDDDDDDEDHRNDWLFDLQEPEGPCEPNPCRHNGVCKEKEKGKRKFKCDCPKPFKGKKCEKGPRLCKRGRCGRGECVVTSTPPYYECKCKEPFQPPNCVQFSTCTPNPCQNGGTCVRDGNDFDCTCPKGFSGRFCHVGPDDCYNNDGESYRGNVSETDDGRECLHWNSEFILESGISPFDSFENEDGLGQHNHCRNPDGDRRPWCFYRKSRKLKWDYCDVRDCDDPTDEPTSEEPTDQPGPTEPVPPPGPQPTEPVPPPPGPASTTHTPTQSPTQSHDHTTLAPIPPTNATNITFAQFMTCGQPQPRKPITRIYGGLKPLPGANPWQVSVQVRLRNTNQTHRHICGGVLIESCWVLTAGHCIPSNQDMQVVVGSQDLSSVEPEEQILSVVNSIRHENYNEKPYAVYNDIGLLQLEGENGMCAEESQFVKTACLPDGPLPDGMECTISGWGATENSSYGSQHLLEANVLLINQQQCAKPEVYGKVLDNGMVCAGHLSGGVDSCQGDSGGPLTCEENTSHMIYGLVSWGDQCGKKNRPGVYTRVTHYLDWIKSKISAATG